MKKIASLAVLAIAVLVLTNCSSTKKTASTSGSTSSMAKSTYESGVQTIIMANCSPCHIPAKGGNKLPLDNYSSVKNNINDIIRRIELTPGTRGFMPMRGQKLSDSTINVFKKWRDDGLAEK